LITIHILSRSRENLLADPMLQLPDAQGGEQKALGARERPDGGHFSGAGILDAIFPRTTTARFRFAGAPRFLAHREMTSVVHVDSKSSFQAMGAFPLVRGGDLRQFARSWLRIGNWVA
jgi:hypothetical protein